MLAAAAATGCATAGVASPEHDAAELLAHVLGTDRSRLPLVDEVPAAALEEYDALVARRAAREPLQHLTGAAWFRHVELAVGPGVFVPRPETELLAGWAIEQRPALSRGRSSSTSAPAPARSPRRSPTRCRRPGCTRSSSTSRRTAGPQRNLAGTGVDLRLG